MESRGRTPSGASQRKQSASARRISPPHVRHPTVAPGCPSPRIDSSPQSGQRHRTANSQPPPQQNPRRFYINYYGDVFWRGRGWPARLCGRAFYFKLGLRGVGGRAGNDEYRNTIEGSVPASRYRPPAELKKLGHIPPARWDCNTKLGHSPLLGEDAHPRGRDALLPPGSPPTATRL